MLVGRTPAKAGRIGRAGISVARLDEHQVDNRHVAFKQHRIAIEVPIKQSTGPIASDGAERLEHRVSEDCPVWRQDSGPGRLFFPSAIFLKTLARLLRHRSCNGKPQTETLGRPAGDRKIDP